MAKGLRHLNGNCLCAIDVETTGLKPGHHEIYQVALLPLDPDLKPRKDIIPFYQDLQILYPDRIDKRAVKMNRLEFARKQQRAIDPFTAADLLDTWFDNLKLPIYKRMCPLAQNWPFDRSFLTAWLGIQSFEHLFSPWYRDTMVVSQCHSDLMDLRSEHIVFPEHNLAFLSQKLGIKNLKTHDALQDCVTTAEVYRRLLRIFT